jgi:SAM-dependent methyltransferase
MRGKIKMSIEFYNQNATEFYNNTVSADMTEAYKEFLQHIKPSSKILDAGCGSGRDTAFFLNQGFTVTSIDASGEMVRMSSELTGQKTLKMSFMDIEFKDEFDGVWACASLLHVCRSEIDEVLEKIIKSLKVGGILYVSFKYGNDEVIRDSRLFNSYNEEAIEQLLIKHKRLKIINIRKSKDKRPERVDEYWINALCKKHEGENV